MVLRLTKGGGGKNECWVKEKRIFFRKGKFKCVNSVGPSYGRKTPTGNLLKTPWKPRLQRSASLGGPQFLKQRWLCGNGHVKLDTAPNLSKNGTGNRQGVRETDKRITEGG